MSANLALEDGLQFGLSDEQFLAWWHSALTAEDADEFINLHRGRRDAARFVCALSYLTGPGKQRSSSSDVIVRAYLIATEQSFDMATSPTIRSNAKVMYEDDSVQMLMERVRYRSKKYAEERIHQRTVNKIEDLYERTKADDVKDDDDLKTMFRKVMARTQTERLALDSSIKYLAVQSRERTAESHERNRRAVTDAMKRNSEKPDYSGGPPDATQLRAYLEIVKEHIGAEAFYGVLQSVLPKSIGDGASTS